MRKFAALIGLALAMLFAPALLAMPPPDAVALTGPGWSDSSQSMETMNACKSNNGQGWLNGGPEIGITIKIPGDAMKSCSPPARASPSISSRH